MRWSRCRMTGSGPSHNFWARDAEILGSGLSVRRSSDPPVIWDSCDRHRGHGEPRVANLSARQRRIAPPDAPSDFPGKTRFCGSVRLPSTKASQSRFHARFWFDDQDVATHGCGPSRAILCDPLAGTAIDLGVLPLCLESACCRYQRTGLSAVLSTRHEPTGNLAIGWWGGRPVDGKGTGAGLRTR